MKGKKFLMAVIGIAAIIGILFTNTITLVNSDNAAKANYSSFYDFFVTSICIFGKNILPLHRILVYFTLHS